MFQATDLIFYKNKKHTSFIFDIWIFTTYSILISIIIIAVTLYNNGYYQGSLTEKSESLAVSEQRW